MVNIFQCVQQASSFNDDGGIVGYQHKGYYVVRTDISASGAGDMVEANKIAVQRLKDPYCTFVEIYWVESRGNGYASADFAEVLIEKVR